MKLCQIMIPCQLRKKTLKYNLTSRGIVYTYSNRVHIGTYSNVADTVYYCFVAEVRNYLKTCVVITGLLESLVAYIKRLNATGYLPFSSLNKIVLKVDMKFQNLGRVPGEV